MLIDYLTLKLSVDACPDWGSWRQLSRHGDRIMRIDTKGKKVWESVAWDSVRSDSHQIAIKASAGTLWIQGSPARLLGAGDPVFGDPLLGMDIQAGARAMIDFVARQLCLGSVPRLELWTCNRIDVTGNFDLETLANVRVALAELRSVEGGRYRVSQQAGDTVYWSHLSQMRSGKAYAKGPHLEHIMKQKNYVGYQYSEQQMNDAKCLLRLELTLRRLWLKKQPAWYKITSDDLTKLHSSFFDRMIGVEIPDMSYVNLMQQAAKSVRHGQKVCSESQGLAAARTWALIQSLGWQAAKESIPKATWYRHLSIIRAAGYGDADISAGRVVSLRRSVLLRPVSCWDDLRHAA